MQIDELVKIVADELTLRKGENLTVIDVKDRTSVTDFMIIATATSSRHALSLAGYVTEKVKSLGVMPLGEEGGQGADWVLVDLGDVLVHIMTDASRNLYQLEKLWSVATRAQEVAAVPEKTLK
jgi:ribosome-associated protein